MLKYVTMLIAHNLQGYIVQVSTLQKWAVQKNRYKMQTKTEKTNTAHYTQSKYKILYGGKTQFYY